MKRVILLLLFAIPFICWGQEKDNKVSQFDLKNYTSQQIEDILECIELYKKSPQYEQDKKRKLFPLCRGVITKNTKVEERPAKNDEMEKPLLIIVDGHIAGDINKIKAENIEELEMLKSKDIESFLGIKETINIVLITTKGKKWVRFKYEATVLDAGFDSFVATQQGIDYYSSDYLRNKNRALVNEWNMRCNQPLKYNPQIYEATIDYDPQNIYGKEVEYTLYMFFKFMETRNRVSFNSLAKL